MRPRALLLLLCSLLGADAGAPELFAGQIHVGNAARRLVGGPDAIGGIGDWALGNGVVCAVVSDPSHEAMLTVRGGVLVDLGHCGRADDQWGVLHPLANLSRDRVVPVEEIRAEQDEHEARIVTRGALSGLSVETTYALGVEDPERLRIRTVVERRAAGERLFLFGDVALHGHRQLSPFTISTAHPEASLGFRHPPVDVDSTLAMARAIVSADLHVLVGGEALEPGIAYGFRLVSAHWERADGTAWPVPGFAINGEDFSLFGVLGRAPWLGGGDELGLLEAAQIPFPDLAPGERLVYERELLPSRRADVASVTDRIFSDAVQIRGRVDDPAARLDVSLADGAPVTQVRPDADGRLSFRLPAGRYALRARAPGGRALRRELLVEADGLDLGLLAVGAPGRVALPSGEPMRLVFVGLDGIADPDFGDDLRGFRVGDAAPPASTASRDISLAGRHWDPAQVVLAPGRYRVFASRGPEYEVSESTLEVEPGATLRLEIAPPRRALATPGWISADLHVHAEASHDSALPIARRIASLVAQGLDVVAATEHDRAIDYGPALRRLGVEGALASLPGAEVTSTATSPTAPFTIGHANVFPLAPQRLAYRGGAPEGEGRRLRALLAEVRARPGARLVQLDHPRSKSGAQRDLNYFTHLAVAGEPFDPVRPLEAAPNRVLVERASESGLRDLDFDLLELMNGEAMPQYLRTRADWLSLLLQGEFRPGTANSDSHRLGELVGLPRNYVRVEDDRVAHFDAEAFVRALRRGRSYGTTGPLLGVTLAGAGPGEHARGQALTLRVEVAAASWVAVDQVRVYVDGAIVHHGAIRSGSPLELPLAFERDAFVTVEVEGRPGRVYRAVAPGFVPFAFSNPIFVDADGDGRWSPPGLPASPPPAIATPLVRDGR